MAAPSGSPWKPPDGPYAGDLPPADAWQMLQEHGDAVLVDVRLSIERTLLGEPDLTGLGRQPVRVEWQTLAGVNPNFRAELKSALDGRGAGPATPLLFLCRSGGRSRVGAIEATALGYQAAYNIANGFEGDLDADKHRNTVNGWRAAGLPWIQS